jgi:serine/threonine protein phosphatase PrpC
MDELMMSHSGKKELDKLTPNEIEGDKGYEEGKIFNETNSAGCTANVVLITKTEIYCANAGDSRSVLSRKGKAKELSQDHKPTLPNEKRRIERANGFVEDSRTNGVLAMSRSIGDFEYKSNPTFKPQE